MVCFWYHCLVPILPVEHKDFTVDFAHPIDNKLATFLQSPASVDSLVIGGSLPAPPSSSSSSPSSSALGDTHAVPMSPHAATKPTASGSARRPSGSGSSANNGTAAYALPTSASRHHEVDPSSASSARGAVHRSRSSQNHSANTGAGSAAATAAAPAQFLPASAAAAVSDAANGVDYADDNDDDQTLMGDADDDNHHHSAPPSSSTYASSLSSPSHIPSTFVSMSPHAHAHSLPQSPFDGSDASMAGNMVTMTPSHSYDELVFGRGANAAQSLPASPAPLCAPSTTEEEAAAAVMSSIGATAALWSSEPFRPQPMPMPQPQPQASSLASSVAVSAVSLPSSHSAALSTSSATSASSSSATTAAATAIPYLLPTNARAGAHAAAQTEIDCAVMDTVLAAHLRARSESAAAAQV